MTLEWEADPDFRLGKLDAVSAWIGGWGKEFFAALPDNASVSPRFQFAALFDAADPGTVFQRRDGGPKKVAVLVQSDQDAQGKEIGAAEIAIKLRMTDPRLMVLPLPDRALPAGIMTNRNALIELPDTEDPAAPQLEGAPPKAVIGIIDHGINFAHDRFRAANGTRVLNAWVQDGVADGPRSVPFGREWRADEIDAMHTALAGDDARILRQMGCLDFTGAAPRPLAFQRSHGTHVLDLAAGFDPGEDRRDLPILGVSLPASVAWESSGAFLGIFFLIGLEYLLARCRAIGPGLPLYVNFSFGLSGGPRGGGHLINRGIDALVTQHQALGGGEVIVTLPAGNRNLARGHAAPRGAVMDGRARFAVKWHLPPGDPSSNTMEMWLRRREGAVPVSGEVTLRLRSPDGLEPPAPQPMAEVNEPIQLRQGNDPALPHSVLLRPAAGEPPIGRATLRRDIATGALLLTLILAPTDPRRTGRDPAPAGTWEVSVESQDSTPETLDMQAWILRDDTLPGFRGTRVQSTFVDTAYRARTPEGFPDLADRENAEVRRAGTMNSIATGKVAVSLSTHHARITVGGTIRAKGAGRARAPTPYSASPLPEGEGWDGPESIACWATSDRTPLRPGVLGAGTMSGTRRMLNGTSVAAPQVLRRLVAQDVRIDGLKAALAEMSGVNSEEPAREV